MVPNVKISFTGLDEYNESLVVVHNPNVLPPPLLSQVMRFGLMTGSGATPSLSGRLKGTREAFTKMIESYGVGVELTDGP
jgi:hypothetical protein